MRLMVAAYDKMGNALKESGRPIVYSLCQYGWTPHGSGRPRLAATCGARQTT